MLSRVAATARYIVVLHDICYPVQFDTQRYLATETLPTRHLLPSKCYPTIATRRHLLPDICSPTFDRRQLLPEICYLTFATRNLLPDICYPSNATQQTLPNPLGGTLEIG